MIDIISVCFLALQARRAAAWSPTPPRRRSGAVRPAVVTRGASHMFNLPTKIAAACGALITAGGVGLALASPASAYYGDDFLWLTCDSHSGIVVGTPTSCPF